MDSTAVFSSDLKTTRECVKKTSKIFQQPIQPKQST